MRIPAATFAAPCLVWLASALVPAYGATSHADLCRAQSVGLTATMKTFLGLKQPKAVALQQSGLKQGGPRRQLADLAYSRLESGTSESAAVDEVRAACLRQDYRALLEDEPEFDQGAVTDGAGPQLCADIASSMSAYLSDAAARTQSIEVAMQEYAPAEHQDRPLPRLRRALELTREFAGANADPKAIADFAMRHCTALDSDARAQLDDEFYVE